VLNEVFSLHEVGGKVKAGVLMDACKRSIDFVKILPMPLWVDSELERQEAEAERQQFLAEAEDGEDLFGWMLGTIEDLFQTLNMSPDEPIEWEDFSELADRLNRAPLAPLLLAVLAQAEPRPPPSAPKAPASAVHVLRNLPPPEPEEETPAPGLKMAPAKSAPPTVGRKSVVGRQFSMKAVSRTSSRPGSVARQHSRPVSRQSRVHTPGTSQRGSLPSNLPSHHSRPLTAEPLTAEPAVPLNLIENPRKFEVLGSSGPEGDEYIAQGEVGALCRLEDTAIVLPSLVSKAAEGKYTLRLFCSEEFFVERLS
jgi:hypothetical protein